MAGFQPPGDVNRDSVIDITDGLRLLFLLYAEPGIPFPCDGAIDEGANLAVIDSNGDWSGRPRRRTPPSQLPLPRRGQRTRSA